MGDRVLVDRPLERGQVGDVALDPREPGERVVVEQQAQPMEVVGGVERDDRGALRASCATVHAPMQPLAPVTR